MCGLCVLLLFLLTHIHCDDSSHDEISSTSSCEAVTMSDVHHSDVVDVHSTPPFRLAIHSSDSFELISAMTRRFGMWEPKKMDQFHALLSADRSFLSTVRHGCHDRNVMSEIVLDVGANLGQFALYSCAHSFPTVAFEPFSRNALLLRRSISLNSFEECVTLYEMGLSNRSEEVNAIWCADNLGVVKIVNPSDPDENRPDCCLRSGCHDTSFQTVTLDEILPTSLAVYLAKIDVEGHESQVIQGAMELFRDACRRPVFAFIEFHGTDSQESDDFLGVLFDLGYLVFANHNFRMDYPLFSVTPSNRREFLRLLERGRREEKWEVDLFISLPTVPRLIA